MTIVTLTSDFGTKDYYVGVIKGTLLSKTPSLNIVDITHDVKNYDIVQAAYILKNTYHSFPKGSIHILSVNNIYSKKMSFIAIKKDDYYFIGPNNGVFSLLFEDKIEQAYKLDYNTKLDFPLKHTFAAAVSHIANGLPFNEIGLPEKKITERITLQPVISKSQIRGSVIHIDNYENVVVNITKELFNRVRKRRKFSLYFKRNDAIVKLSRQYYDVPVGETLCLFNSAGYLEIAINMGKASSLLGLNVDDTIQIDFH